MEAITTTIDRPARGSRKAAKAIAGAGVRALVRHRIYIGIVLAYSVACLATGRLAGTSELVDISFFGDAFIILIASFVVVLVLGHASWMAAIVRPRGSLFAAIGRDFKARFVQADRIAGFLVVTALAPLFFSSFGSFKRMIPALSSFSWDPSFMQWDRWLHGGEHAWRLLQPILGSPVITNAINFAYNGWFFVLFFTFIWQAASTRDARLRMQFLLSFVFTWIVLGTVLGTIFASGGPV
ncbi:MAG: phosphatase PAP2 family protein, partial [Alphaproteobacteria bacterium]